MCTTEDLYLLNSMLVKASITHMSYFYVYIGNGNYGIIPTWESVIVQNKLKNWAHSVSEEIGGLEKPSYL